MHALLPLLLTLTTSVPQSEAGAAGVVELPMRMRGAMPAVEVRVNGKGPFLFAIDTCASGPGRADAALVRELALPAVGEARGGDGSGRSAAMQVVRVERLELGGLVFAGLELPARDYNTRPELPRIHGILGYELFAHGVLTLDFPGQRVRYAAGATLPEPDEKGVLALADEPVAALELVVGEHSLRAHLDTGNLSGRFVLPSAFVAELTPTAEPVAAGRARTVAGEIEIRRVPIAETIRLGTFEFPGESVTYPGPGPTANVGAAVLGEFRVSFDAAHRRVRFER